MKKDSTIPVSWPVFDPNAPISKEEALDRSRTHRTNGHYRDGFDGMTEGPVDSETIDPVVYPQGETQFERECRERCARDDKRMGEVRGEADRKSRDFRISESAALGGPPGSIFDDEK